VPEETWLTTAELAGRLSVSESTIRNWRKAFGDLMPQPRGHERLRRYALRPFELIAVMRDRKLPTEEIRRVLAEDGNGPPTVEDSGARMASAMEELTVGVKRLTVAFDRISDAVERIADALASKDG
jgi:DNA-binding transcriptional MerR regulator